MSLLLTENGSSESSESSVLELDWIGGRRVRKGCALSARGMIAKGWKKANLDDGGGKEGHAKRETA